MGSYCVKCGNKYIDIDGNPCTCRPNVQSFYDTVSCLDIPEQYRGLTFSQALVPSDVHESYGAYLQGIYNEVIAGKWTNHNLLLASPVGHSKTILAYSCIEALFRSGIPTFPVYDVLELKRILMDMDLGRKQLYDVENPEDIILVPTLFAKIPRALSWEVFDTIVLLMDRRVRRGNSTIFLFDGSWNELANADKRDILAGLIGDGTYNTIESKSWGITQAYKKPDLMIPENLG